MLRSVLGQSARSIDDVVGAKTRVPDVGALRDLAVAAGENARRLLDDTEILLKHGRWPTAYSLAVLAFEEAGKSWLCVITMLMQEELKDQVDFGGKSTGHLEKLQAARMMAGLLDFVKGRPRAAAAYLDALEALEELARQDNLAKQRGLYADFKDGIVSSPSQITQSMARDMVSVVRDVLVRGAPFAEAGFISWVADLPEEIRLEVDTMFRTLADTQGQEGPEAAVAFMQVEFSKLDGFIEMLEAEAQRLALTRVAAPLQTVRGGKKRKKRRR